MEQLSTSYYLDHQASSPIAGEVLTGMQPYWAESFGNPHSSDHIVGWNASAAIKESQRKVATLIGSEACEIIFTSGATEANNLAILGVCEAACTTSKRKKIIVSAIEHKCVMASAELAAKRGGFTVLVAPVDSEGYVDISWLNDNLDGSVLLLSVVFVNNEIGTIQNIQKIAEICNQHGVLLHSDCAQAPAAQKIDWLAETCDLISLSAHKMNGPMGIGALFVKNSIRERISPQIVGGGQQGGLRSGTLPLPICVGMGVAAELWREHGDTFRTSMIQARSLFYDIISSKLAGSFFLNGPPLDARHPGNLNIGFKGEDASNLLMRLQPRLCASTGSACTSGSIEPSHVLSSIGLDRCDADASIRFSFGHGLDDTSIIGAANIVVRIIKGL